MQRPYFGVVLAASLAIGVSFPMTLKGAYPHKLQKRGVDDSINTETRDAYDPCLNSRHIEINDPRRSVQVFAPSYDAALDDGRFPIYWYRFTSGAGGIIPTTPPSVGQCGTLYPMWMDGAIPLDDNSTHDTRVCQTDGEDARYACLDAKVKNCTDYIVYRLPPTPSEKAAYCAGDGVECPPDHGSPSGFTPCEHKSNIPAVPQPPKVQLNEADDTYFYLECHLTNPDAAAVHDIRWIADGNIFHRQTLAAGVAVASLEEDDMRFRLKTIIGYHVQCEVSARKVDFAIGSRYTRNEGKGFFLGFQFVNAAGEELREIVIDEDDKGPSLLYLKPSAPIRCNAKSYVNLPDFLKGPCKISVKVRNGDLDEFSAQLVGKCSREKQISVKDLAAQIDFQDCRVNIHKEDWRDFNKHKLLINAIKDKVFDGQQSRYIDLDVQAENQRVWNGYEPPYVKVTIKDSDIPEDGLTRCKSLNDPHMTTFDGLKYENMLVGEFILYENPEHNFRVHAYFIKCNNDRASCNCGVAAQAGDDVILFDRCNKFGDIVFGGLPEEVKEKGFLRMKVLPRGEMTQGFTLEHEKGTNKYTINFPHGAELHINAYGVGTEHINLEMVPSQEDYANLGEPQKVRGLCGTYSKAATDDLVKFDGNLYQLTDADKQGGRWYPNTFSESWRIPEGSPRSMYNGQITITKAYTGHQFCACLKMSDLEVAVCAFGDDCREKEDLTGLVDGRTRRRRRSLDTGHDHVRDFDDSNFSFTPGVQTETKPEEIWPTASGWTKRDARNYCDNLIKSAPFYEKCKDLTHVNLQEDIKTCVTDIGLVGTTDFALGIREAAESKCNERITTDMNMWTVNPETKLFDPPRLVQYKELKTAAQISSSISGSRYVPDEHDEAEGRPMMTIRHGTKEATGTDTYVPNPDIADTICPESCNGNGRCVKQKCECNEGFMGKSCGYVDGPPSLYKIQGGGLCSTPGRPCNSAPMLGLNFVESEGLKCIFTPIEHDAERVLTTPEFETYMEIHCPVPPSNLPFRIYDVQVSNNGDDPAKTSRAQRLIVYDSGRATCTMDGCTLIR